MTITPIFSILPVKKTTIFLALTGALSVQLPGGALAQVIDTSIPEEKSSQFIPSIEPLVVSPSASALRIQNNLQLTDEFIKEQQERRVEEKERMEILEKEGYRVPWVLKNDQHPWPLIHQLPSTSTVLSVSLPTPNEVKVSLPGYVSDMIARVRFASEKYITDSIGVNTTARRKQLERLIEWLEKNEEQEKTLSGHPWVDYQFRLESRTYIIEFRDKIAKQSFGSIAEMRSNTQNFINELSELMPNMPTYDQQTGIYKVMTNLQEGVSLFEAQVNKIDNEILSVIDKYLEDRPALPPPPSKPPKKEDAYAGGGLRPEYENPKINAEPTPPSIVSGVNLTSPEAQGIEEAPQQQADYSNTKLGLVEESKGNSFISSLFVLIGLVGAGFYGRRFFIKKKN